MSLKIGRHFVKRNKAVHRLCNRSYRGIDLFRHTDTAGKSYSLTALQFGQVMGIFTLILARQSAEFGIAYHSAKCICGTHKFYGFSTKKRTHDYAGALFRQ